MTTHPRLIFDVPEAEWLTANGRYHWREKARRTKALRHRASIAARGVVAPDPCLVVVHVGYATGVKADPSNAFPTAKALIDGCVDAGMWPDDDSTHILGPTFLRGPKHGRSGFHVVELALIDQEVPF